MMRIGGYWLVAMVVGFSAIVVLRASSGLPEEQRQSIVVALVMLATCVLAIARFRSQSVKPTDAAPAVPDVRTTHVNIEKRRFHAAWGGVTLLLVAWCVALSLGHLYDDADSRLTILNGLSLFTALVATAALLLAPSASVSIKSLVALVAIVIVWFAGTILLPYASSWLWGSSYGIERVVNAVPGRSFIPVAALLLRSIGHRIGLRMWVGRQR